jgi:hypothetical protein
MDEAAVRASCGGDISEDAHRVHAAICGCPRCVTRCVSVADARPGESNATKATLLVVNHDMLEREIEMATESAHSGAAIGGWICFILGMVVMFWSLWLFLVYGPLFLVSFVLAIVCLTQRKLTNGLSLLLAVLIVPATTLLFLGTLRADAALKELDAETAKARSDATRKGVASRTATLSAPAARAPTPEPTSAPQDDPMLYLAAEKLELYDFKAKYFDSVLDGRIPGVEFKLRNKGDRALKKVRVVVYFQDANGATIAEEDYTPVLSGGFSNGTPLKPGYIWQQERGRFLSAKKIPSEWKEGAAFAKITEIQFE